MEISKVLALIVSVGLLLLGTGICVLVDDDGTIVIKRPAPPQLPTGTGHLDADNNIEPSQVAETDVTEPNLANVGPDFHEDTRDETPPGISREEADEALITPPNPLPADEEYVPQPVGGAQNFRCPENYVRNGSPRITGVRVSMFVLHITVSAPGSLRAIWNLFNNPASGASSTYLLELDKECEQILPFGLKPWTQMAFNSSSEAVEIVTNLMTRNEWLSSPIIRDATLAQLAVSRLKARGLPPRLVDPVGCTPQAGITDHERLECGNDHVDVGSGFPWGPFMDDVRQIYKHGTLCDATCVKIKRVEKRHKATHAAYQRRGCRGRLHEVKARDLKRERCQRIKRRGHHQHQTLRELKS